MDVTQKLQRWTGLSSLALLAATWRLWTPQTLFPQIPVVYGFIGAPAWLDWFSFVALIVGLILLATGGQRGVVPIGCLFVVVALAMSIALDQHRFQPWAYALGLFCTVWLCCRDALRVRLLRWLLISIYCYSAAGKFDFEFLHTVGQQMLAVSVRWLGVDVSQWSDTSRIAFVWLIPFVELVIGIALAFRPTRRLAGGLAMAMHLVLILILGPSGLNHQLGVLVWNTQIALQVYWLFVSRAGVPAEHESTPANAERGARIGPRMQWLGIGIVVAAIALPITERIGGWDHWPSWALYAPYSSRVQIQIAAPAVKNLPAVLQALVELPDEAEDEIAVWHNVPIDAWSLRSLQTPIYPQARFQFGVAEAIANQLGSQFSLRIVELGAASRFTGVRSSVVYHTKSQLEQRMTRFNLNTFPRHVK